MGPPQGDVRTAYRDVLSYLHDGGRVQWAASSVTPTVQPGDFVVPGGLDTSAGHVDVTATLPLSHADPQTPPVKTKVFVSSTPDA